MGPPYAPPLPVLLDDLPTPALLVEEARLSLNLDRMQARARTQNVALRPHLKTHKSVALARLQKERGAKGVTVAKPSEAEAFAGAVFDDVRIAYPVVGADRLRHVVALTDRARVSFGVDTRAGAEAAAAAFDAAGKTAEVLVEVDTGYGRTGVRWDDPAAVAFAAEVAARPGLRLAGIFTHEGHAYAGPRDGETPTDARRRIMAESRDRILLYASRLAEAGLAVPGAFEVSVGSTPTCTVFENATGPGGFTVTEIRPGNYVFLDAIGVHLGAGALADCALTVLATVVSKQTDALGQQRVFLDAGKKVFTSDGGYGTEGYGIPLYNARAMRVFPHLRLTALSEEHGWAEVHGTATLDVGDRVRVVPNHACVTVATQDRLHLVRGDEVVETWAVDARDGVR